MQLALRPPRFGKIAAAHGGHFQLHMVPGAGSKHALVERRLLAIPLPTAGRQWALDKVGLNAGVIRKNACGKIALQKSTPGQVAGLEGILGKAAIAEHGARQIFLYPGGTRKVQVLQRNG